MGKIITHSGNAHLDDFLSVCVLLCKDKQVDTIERKAEVSEEEAKDTNIWKIDIGMEYDPNKRAFDHHQEGIDDCAFSLLLKNWEIWDRSKEVYSWIPAMVKIDTSGLGTVLSHHRVSYETYFRLSSFVEESLMQWFQKCNIISKKKNKLLFYTMKGIGKQFFAGIKTYYQLIDEIQSKLEVKVIGDEGEEEDLSKGIPILFFLTKKPKYNSHLLRIFNSYKEQHFPNYHGGWITAYTYDRPKGTICLRRHGNPKNVDLSRLKSLEKTEFAHPKGFVAVVEKMSDIELKNYIQHAIK
jgi:hypothetical protein